MEAIQNDQRIKNFLSNNHSQKKKKEKIRKKKQWEENDEIIRLQRSRCVSLIIEAIASCFRARWIFDNCETRSTGLSTLIY